MTECFVISDTHFGHRSILEFRRYDGAPVRPFSCLEEMHETIAQRWNAIVRPGDKVYHLGDVALNKKALPILARCNGRKHLIKGNHDIYPIKDYLKYFYNVSSCRRFSEGILTHIPMHRDELVRFGRNMHGHTHLRTLGSPYINVCVEYTSYAPVPLDLAWRMHQ